MSTDGKDIMMCLWRENRSMTVEEITKATRKRHYCVVTATDNLFGMGWAERSFEGGRARYAAAVTSEEYTATLMHEELTRAMAPQAQVLVALMASFTPTQRQMVSAALSAIA
ncbi:BlaI/MecI/CopY family transcriptional regulator [Streptomyces sp. NPDC091416]|uniref:BlaI/MecI/CopY family transcriptional regulator n=1 Tax=Streptomyces sp. NPDC091416 TaxID=3366003 RepID=UPI00381BB9F1